MIKQLKADANSGDYHAAHALATAYAVGDGVAKDSKESDYWRSVEASRREQKRADQAAEKQSGRDDHSPSTQANDVYRPNGYNLHGSTPGQFTFGSSNSQKTGIIDWTPARPQPASETSTWNKAKAYVSEHTDEITDLATFVIEQYVTGGESSEGTTKNSGASAKPSK